MKHKLQNALKPYGYTMASFTERKFTDMDIEFTVYTVELKEDIEDYNDLLIQEKEIANGMGFYENNIILELL